jgi:hypothetical protein
MLDFSNSLAIRSVIGTPGRRRVHIKILPIQVQPLLNNQLIEMLDYSLASLEISKIQQPAVGASQYPLWMIHSQPGTGVHSFRLEPRQGFYSL